ncbi:MAG: glycosyltransferase family 9 protein [Elusimicrobia bacterium]|nr:glycosyltransferase family 9 protein [Elusimicrobiota bacterium]
MTTDRWDPRRCNDEKPGAGLIGAADWFGAGRPAPFPSDEALRARLASRLESHPKIQLLISHKGGMGDTVMCTTVAHELRRRGMKDIWLETRWVEDFAGQSVFDGVLPESYETEWLAVTLGGRIVYPAYARALPAEDREIGPAGHILGEMCRQAGIVGRITLRPYFQAPGDGLRDLPEDFIAISGAGGHAVLTKNWFQERYHALSAMLRKDLRLVQLGSPSEPPIDGADDWRGRTTLRQAADVLKRARCYVGEVGGLMHLARAVDCPAVVIYGGREAPRQSGYVANVNLAGNVPCSPCWIIKNCPHEMGCMDLIRPADVAAAVRRLLDSCPGRPLHADSITLE